MITQALPKAPPDLWRLIRHGEYDGVTGSLAPGYVQANLVILPRSEAFDFLLFCQRNPRPCPLVEVMDPASSNPSSPAPDPTYGPTSRATESSVTANS